MAAFAKRPKRRPYWAELHGKPDGDYPNVFIFRGMCPNLIGEMQFLRYRESGGMSTIDTNGPDDLIDPMEYLLEYWNIGVSFRHHARLSTEKRKRRYDSTGYYEVRNEPDQFGAGIWR